MKGLGLGRDGASGSDAAHGEAQGVPEPEEGYAAVNREAGKDT